MTYAGAFAGANALTLNGPGNITFNANVTTPSVITVNSSVGAFTFGGTRLNRNRRCINLKCCDDTHLCEHRDTHREPAQPVI